MFKHFHTVFGLLLMGAMALLLMLGVTAAPAQATVLAGQPEQVGIPPFLCWPEDFAGRSLYANFINEQGRHICLYGKPHDPANPCPPSTYDGSPLLSATFNDVGQLRCRFAVPTATNTPQPSPTITPTRTPTITLTPSATPGG